MVSCEMFVTMWAVYVALRMVEGAILEVYPNFHRDGAEWLLSTFGGK